MSKKEKVKNWIKENKMAIFHGVAGGTIAAIGVYVGYRGCLKDIGGSYVVTDKDLECLLRDANDNMKGIGRYLRIFDKGLKPSELGELGKAMLEVGCPADQEFTHFVALTESDKF